MNRLEMALDRGLDDLRTVLRESGTPPERVQEVGDLVSRLSFPGLLTFLGGSAPGEGTLGTHFLQAAAEHFAATEEAHNAGLDAEEAERLLAGLLVQRRSPRELLADGGSRRSLLRSAVQALAEAGELPATPGEVSQIARLLETGQFFSDVETATAAILTAVPRLPIALVGDVLRFPFRAPWLVAALASDLAATPGLAFQVFGDLRDGRLDNPPGVLAGTLRLLYGLATIGAIVATLRELLSNETVRVAVILYARANGVSLGAEDLDTLRDSVFRPGEPDLGPALVSAWQRLEKEHEFERARKLLERLGRPLPGLISI